MAKIPRFRTEEEMREFWDTHDSAAYFEDMEDDVVQVTFIREKGVLVLPLGEGRLRSVREIALEEGVSSNLLLKNWIDEGIKRKMKVTRPTNKRKNPCKSVS
ncbi:MAG: CopG family antitoxin [Halobacteriota archaeon]